MTSILQPLAEARMRAMGYKDGSWTYRDRSQTIPFASTAAVPLGSDARAVEIYALRVKNEYLVTLFDLYGTFPIHQSPAAETAYLKIISDFAYEHYTLTGDGSFVLRQYRGKMHTGNIRVLYYNSGTLPSKFIFLPFFSYTPHCCNPKIICP